jgi:hypothetical protein
MQLVESEIARVRKDAKKEQTTSQGFLDKLEKIEDDV